MSREYRFIHMISFLSDRYGAPDGVNRIGKFDLNFFQLPTVSKDGDLPAHSIAETIAKLVSKCIYVPLSLNLLNAESFRPKRLENDRLNYASLQLSKDTYLILDETILKKGKLEEQGMYIYFYGL